MELKHYVIVFWKWGWLLLLSTLLAAGLSFQMSNQLPRVYSATVTLMVGEVLQQINPNQNDISTTQQLAQTYGLLVRRQPLLQAATDELGLNIPPQVLANQVSAAAVPNTQLIQITVLDTVPERARVLADELGHQLILQSPTPVERDQAQRQDFVTKQLSVIQVRINQAEDELKGLENRLTLETSARGVSDIQNQMTALQQKITTWQATYAGLLTNNVGRLNQLNVVEPAVVSAAPISPNIPLNVGVAALVGLVLASVAALILEYLDDTLATNEAVERVLKLPTLGVIGRVRRARQAVDGLITMRDHTSPIAEAYRVVRTNIEFTRLRNPPRALLVTSAIGHEGKTTTICNLGIVMAQTGKRVIICDTDLRRPSVHRFFGASHEIGLTSLLLNERMATDEALLETRVPGLSILPSGPLPANPVELLFSEPMRERVAELKAMADIVLFDGPAVLPIADSPIIGGLCDGVILVIDARRTRSELVKQAVDRLDQVGLKVLGVVLNQAPTHDSSYYGGEETEAQYRRPRFGLAAIWGGLSSIGR